MGGGIYIVTDLVTFGYLFLNEVTDVEGFILYPLSKWLHFWPVIYSNIIVSSFELVK